MKVTVTRSGGFAGIAVRWQVFVEKEPDEDDWLVLLGNLPWDDVPQGPPQPDRYQYRIDCEPVEAATQAHREAVIPEQKLTGPWRELVDRVRERDEQKRELRPVKPSSTPES